MSIRKFQQQKAFMKKILALLVVTMVSSGTIKAIPSYDVLDEDDVEPTTLLEAIWNGREDLIREFIDKPGELEKVGWKGNTPLLLTCKLTNLSRQQSLRFVKKLLKEGADVSTTNDYMDNALTLAARVKEEKLIERLLKTGLFDLNHTNSLGENALIITAKYRELSFSQPITTLLLSYAVATEKNMFHFLCFLKRYYPGMYEARWIFYPWLRYSYHTSLKKLLTAQATTEGTPTAHDLAPIELLDVEKIDQTRAQLNPFKKVPIQ